MSYTPNQAQIVESLEILGACMSSLVCSFVILTYATFKPFRKAANRILFYAAINNLIYSISGFINLHGLRQGILSPLCQFQAFIIQAALPSDALWNFAVAINAFTAATKSRPNIVEELKSRELIYLIVCCAFPYALSLILVSVRTPVGGGDPFFGDANMWCWFAGDYTYLRLIAVYGISWICVAMNFAIYAWIGFRFWRLRKNLYNSAHDVPLGQYQGSTIVSTNNVTVTSPVERYIITCALFFSSSLITWVPSSVNRIFAIVYGGANVPFSLNAIAAFVLQLTGFWNGLVYVVMSRHEIHRVLKPAISEKLHRKGSKYDDSIGTDIEALSTDSASTKVDTSLNGIQKTTVIEQSVTKPESIHEPMQEAHVPF